MRPASDVIPRTLEALELGVASGREPGVQFYASLRGEPVADVALGEARFGVPMQADTLVLWISVSKPVMGIAYGRLLERGALALDDPIEKYLPAFGQGGKQDVTLRHALTHTCGFRSAWRDWIAPSFDNVIEAICSAPQEDGWQVGLHCGYNVAAAWYALAAVLQRVDGRDYGAFVRDEIFAPLGMDDCWIGIPPEAFQAYGPRIGAMPFLSDGEWRNSESWGTEVGCGILRPGGNGYGPMRQHVRLYEMLLGGGERDGVRILDPETATEISRRHTDGLHDQTFMGIYDRGLGVVLDSQKHEGGSRWFGPRASPRAFGHQGFFSSVAFADPEHGLAAGLVFHGVRQDAAHDARVAEALEALYVDLDLVGA